MIRAFLASTLGGLAVVAYAALWLIWTTPGHAGEPCRGIVGLASYYGVESCVRPPPNCRTANGERYTGNSFTAAMVPGSHIGERWRVTYIGTARHPGTGKSVVVRVNDTGDFAKLGRLMDLSKAAARAIGMIRVGVGRVCVERL